MKKRTAIIGALVSLLPMGQPLMLGTGVSLTSAAVMLSVPESVKAESAEFYFNRAYKKAEEGDHYGAISELSKAIEINPRHAVAYYNRGIEKKRLKDYSGAISDYTKAIEINPKYVNAYSNRGAAKLDSKDFYGSISDSNKAIQLDPNDSTIHISYNNRAKAKYLIGDNKGACIDARKAASSGSDESKRILAGSIGEEICGTLRN